MSLHGILAHIEFKQVLHQVGLTQTNLLQPHLLSDEVAELVGRNLTKAFEPGDFRVGTQFVNGSQSLIITVTVGRALLVAYTEEGCLQDIDVAFFYKVGEFL